MEFSGDWHSYYRYPSSGRGDDFWGQHLLHATQDGNKLTFQNGVESPSHVVIELEVKPEERKAVGTWHERTDPGGYYKGVTYEGTIELKIAESGRADERRLAWCRKGWQNKLRYLGACESY